MLNKNKDNKQTYHSKEYQQFIILRLVSWIFIGLLLAGAIISGFFIYQNTFFTIEKIQSIILLENDPTAETINFLKYDKVKKNWEEKNLPTNLQISFDPFNPPISTTTPTSTNKK